MTPPVPPEEDIGPFYKALGGILVFGDMAFLLLQAWMKHDFDWQDAGIQAVLFLLFLLIVRPTKFDNFVKELASKLPFVKYGDK